MKRRQRSQALERVNLLELAPVRLARWEDDGERVVIERPKPVAWRPVGQLLRYWLAVRRIRLDARGSAVWRCLDGSTTVEQVAATLRSQFGKEVEPAEERIGQLVRMLHTEDLVAFPGWDRIDTEQEC